MTNLEWSSGSANVSHAYRIGLRQSKLSESEVEHILQQLEQGLTQRKLRNEFNVSHSTIGEINRGKIWR